MSYLYSRLHAIAAGHGQTGEKTGGNEQRKDAECVRFSFAVLHDGKKQRRLNLI